MCLKNWRQSKRFELRFFLKCEKKSIEKLRALSSPNTHRSESCIHFIQTTFAMSKSLKFSTWLSNTIFFFAKIETWYSFNYQIYLFLKISFFSKNLDHTSHFLGYQMNLQIPLWEWNLAANKSLISWDEQSSICFLSYFASSFPWLTN